jgi:hypothetical protein
MLINKITISDKYFFWALARAHLRPHFSVNKIYYLLNMIFIYKSTCSLAAAIARPLAGITRPLAGITCPLAGNHAPLSQVSCIPLLPLHRLADIARPLAGIAPSQSRIPSLPLNRRGVIDQGCDRGRPVRRDGVRGGRREKRG